jgi:L-ascorbate metabolism protein UlaG (beta-lactamase superfamily)
VELASGTKLLFDPFISPNELAKEIAVDAIEADYVLLTHGHADHVADAEAILKRTGATLISNFEVVAWFGTKGIDRAHAMNHGGGYDFPFGRVTYVQAIHSSSMPDGSYGGQPGGFVIESEDGTIYVSGDTALHTDQKLLAERFEIDLAVLCIGDNFTMGPADAAVAATWVGAKTVVGTHYDTFPPIVIDKDQAAAEFRKRGVELRLLEIGESISIESTRGPS